MSSRSNLIKELQEQLNFVKNLEEKRNNIILEKNNYENIFDNQQKEAFYLTQLIENDELPNYDLLINEYEILKKNYDDLLLKKKNLK